jgi:hypothetical protein
MSNVNIPTIILLIISVLISAFVSVQVPTKNKIISIKKDQSFYSFLYLYLGIIFLCLIGTYISSLAKIDRIIIYAYLQLQFLILVNDSRKVDQFEIKIMEMISIGLCLITTNLIEINKIDQGLLFILMVILLVSKKHKTTSEKNNTLINWASNIIDLSLILYVFFKLLLLDSFLITSFYITATAFIYFLLKKVNNTFFYHYESSQFWCCVILVTGVISYVR